MFVEIEKINTRGEKGVALIDLATIVGVVSQPNHFTRLYNENGDLVSETQDENRFAVITNCGQVYNVEKSTYDILKGLLVK